MTRPSSVYAVFAILLALGATSVLAAGASPEKIVLRPDASSTPVGLTLQSESDTHCTVSFDLPYLHQETVTANGEIFQALTIPGGGLEGEVGLPGLPTYSGLLALPNGRGVQATVLAREDETLTNLRVLPVQPDDATGFVIDAAYDDAAAKQRTSTVTFGDPAIMHGRRVVPFTIKPVVSDPASSTVTVASRLEIEFSFVGDDGRNNPQRARADLPTSFVNLFADRVVNSDRSGAAHDAATEGLGTYLVICPDNISIVNALEPLLEWRRRQGYSVQLATTAETGPTNSTIKNFIQNVYDTATVPLEFVVLVGDANGTIAVPTWWESLSGYNGEGDHYYSELEGDDVLPDVFVGRLSCRNTTELTTIVSKIVSYETAPPTTDAGWFTRGSVTGDPSDSGNTTIQVSQWLKAQLEATGFTQVDTIWSGNFASGMYNSLSQGLSVFSYRGFWGMSGFTSGHISSLNNGGKLPFALFPTCASGSWASETSARNETFLRRANGGAIGAVALATTGTHTRYNNCLYNGVGETLINSDDHRQGVAQAGGKLEMFAQYQQTEPNKVEIWSVWSTLIGDPATDIWLSYPTTLSVDHPAALPVGVGAVPITVTAGGEPVAGAVVAVYKDGEISVSATTDAAGRVTLALPSHSSGSLLVTVWGHGLMPYRGSLALGNVNLFVDLVQTNVDDDGAGGSNGNGDGVVNPSEILQLTCALLNRGSDLAGAVTATLTSDDPYVTIVDAEDTYGDVAGGATAWGAGEFLVYVAPNAPSSHELALILTASSGGDEWVSVLRLPVVAPALGQTAFDWSLGADLDPGESGLLSVTLSNSGGVIASGATGVLTAQSPWITITDALGTFGDIPISGEADNSADPFAVEVALDCFQGHLATFELAIADGRGVNQVVEFSLPVGSVSSSDPVGPDAYGYYAFDNTDTDYLLAPTYEWVDIDPRFGGAGTSVGLTDFGYEQDDTRTLDLPFTFTYYGRGYDQIAVCSNGWIAMGSTSLENWRNWGIPGAGSPDAMIAPFWDDLKQSSQNLVYYWHDTANQRFIVQWSRMTNTTGAAQNFEVILYDPLAYPTASGDGEILCQYATVTNNDTSRGYATTGIQNLDGTGGVLYTYYNRYAPGAPPLTAGRAILFRTAGGATNATCDIVPESVTVTLGTDQQAVENLRVENNGEAGSVLRYRLDKVDPDAPTALPNGDKNLTGSVMTTDVETYPNAGTIDIVFTASCNSSDDEWIVDIEADFPPEVTVNSATHMFGGDQTLFYDGDEGSGAMASWSNGVISDNRSASATLNLTFAETAGLVEIPYTLYGDNYGSPPHQVTGTIVLVPTGPTITVMSPNGGEIWPEGNVREIQFSATGGPETVDIELDRGDGDGWRTLASDIPATTTSYPWTVTGPLSAQCRVRVIDTADPSLHDSSDDPFTIGRDLSWVTVGEYGGIVTGGAGENIDLAFDSTGLADGTYRATLIVTNTAGSAIDVPITLLVGETTGTEIVPQNFGLAKNYPNPFNPRTTIGFALPKTGAVRLRIYDMQGRLVKSLHDGVLAAGYHSLDWDGTDAGGRPVASGLFVYRLENGDEVLSRKMLLMK